jgi:hypothetical protein
VHHRHGDVVRQENAFGQRNQVEHHAEIGGVQGHAIEQVAGAGQRDQRVEQSNPVEAERDSKPKD